ncbi:MAG: hypothetical protein ACTSR2_13035 [Candidatus Hodarchaeales archaeon]
MFSENDENDVFYSTISLSDKISHGSRFKPSFWGQFWEAFINEITDRKRQLELLHKLGFIPLEIHLPQYSIGVQWK